MKRLIIVLSTIAAFSVIALSQAPSNTTGAKQLFHDTTTNVTLKSTTVPAPRSGSTGGAQPPASAPKPTTDVTGLQYYVEIIQPSGQVLRVNTTQTFHNGQRIRFHVIPNLTGKLTILQSENDGAFLPLFPNAALRGGDDRVEQGKDTVIPMAFDNRPGNIRLLLMLTADSAATPATPTRGPVASSPTPATGGGAATPTTTQTRPAAPPQTTQPVQRASNEPMARSQGPLTAAEINAVLGRQAGSKALKIEVDESPAQAATYVVVDTRQDARHPAGMVAVEIKLTHQP